MFGDKLAAAQKQIVSLTALIASTGFKIEAGAETSVEAFKAHLDAQTKTAIDAALAPVAAQAASATAAHAGLLAGIQGAGVKIGTFKAEDFVVAEGKTAADTSAATSIKTAIETAIAAKSAKQIASSGHPNALPIANDAPAAATGETAPQSKEEFLQAHAAISDPAKKTAYFRKYRANFAK